MKKFLVFMNWNLVWKFSDWILFENFKLEFLKIDAKFYFNIKFLK